MARTGKLKKPTISTSPSRGGSGYLGPPTPVAGPVKQYYKGSKPAGGSRGFTAGTSSGTTTTRKSGASTASMSQGTTTRQRTVNVSSLTTKKKKK